MEKIIQNDILFDMEHSCLTTRLLVYLFTRPLVYLFIHTCCSFVCKGETVINLSDRREIFVDCYLIDRLEGVSLQLQKPCNEGVTFYYDKPWEGAFSGYVTIIKERDIFRAYYRGEPIAGEDGNDGECTCYAESKDGIHWEKPRIGLFKINGSYDNNVILAGATPVSHNFSPFLDTNPGVLPSERYKAVGGIRSTGLIAYVSADGIKWKKRQDKPLLKGENIILDSQNVIFWSENEQCYLCYHRSFTGDGIEGFRSISRSTSPDFLQWSPSVRMTFGDTPLEHLYTNQTHPYFNAPHIYVAIGGRFFPGKRILNPKQAKQLNVEPSYFNDCSDAYFMTTRGGTEYIRTFMEGFIRPGIGLNNWVSRSNYPALNVVQTGKNEMSFYVSQDYAQPTAHLHRYSLRIDGFSSVNAPYAGGDLFTKPFTFSGKELEINYATSAAGELQFEVMDEQGIPVPGYSMEDSDVIIGNEIARIVSWKGNTNLEPLASKTIRLHVRMKDADLYSIRFK
jgi:hypothetical protein